MVNGLKELPSFTTEEEEREFWANQDSTEYIDWDEASAAVFPQLKPTTKSITKPLRPFGLCTGEFVVPDDFDAPLPEHIMQDFECV